MERKKSIELLNRAVADELAAVHQYMYFHFHLDDQGFGPLALLYKRTAIEEMMHIERLAERILFLKGEVELVPSVAVEKITDPEKVLAKAVAMEGQSIADYNESAKVCAAHSDAQSKQLFESLIADEERHQDQYEKQMENIQRFGPLALLFKRTAIEEMMHIERLAERILFLKGEVELIPSVAVEKITEPEKVLAKAVAMEGQSISDYNEWAKVCADHSDAQSKQLFEALIADEERHQDQYEKQMDNIRRFGPSYLALQAMSAPADAPKGGAAE